jgi:mono/diheme cytochrome c family protein
MLPASMPRRTVRTLIASALVPAALAVAGCGDTIEVAKNDPLYKGAQIFNQRCGGCHTFDDASTEGSATKVNSAEYKDGPNFNVRKEQYDGVLYAIRNGGFSSGPMPQNIVVGRDAQIVACFVATHSGKQAKQIPTPGKQPAAGSGPEDCAKKLGGG